MSSPEQFVNPIYRFLWPTPQSIFFPVSHRVPSKEALLSQMYSAALYRYIYIDSRSNTMRARHSAAFGSKVNRNTRKFQSKGGVGQDENNTTTTTEITPELLSDTSPPQSHPIPSRKTKSTRNRQLKFTPAPQFPHQALMILFWYHLSVARYPAAASGLDLESYRADLSSPWALTKVFAPHATPPAASARIISTQSGVEQVSTMVEVAFADDQQTTKISHNQPDGVGPVPASHREQLHSQFYSTPVDRVLYPLLDHHRVPLPLSEQTFLNQLGPEVNKYQDGQLATQVNVVKNDAITTPSPSPTNENQLHSFLSSIHMILKQQLPVKQASGPVNEVDGSGVEASNSSVDEAADREKDSRKKNPTGIQRGSRTIALKHASVDELVQDIAEKKALKGEEERTDGSTTAASSSPAYPSVINPAWSQSLVSKLVKGSHAKTRTKLLKSSQYLLFGSQLLLQRHIAKTAQKTRSKSVQKKLNQLDDSDGLLTMARLVSDEMSIGEDVTNFEPQLDLNNLTFSPFVPQSPSTQPTPRHLSNVAKAFYDLVVGARKDGYDKIGKVKINNKKRRSTTNTTSFNSSFHHIIGPSYDAFNRFDHFKAVNCLYDEENNVIGPCDVVGDVSPTSTTQSIQSSLLSPTQATPSSVIISCSPEKPEVWGTMMFALSLLNAKILQNQLGLGQNASTKTSQKNQNQLEIGSTSSTNDNTAAVEPIHDTIDQLQSIDSHPALPPVNAIQPNAIAVESHLLTLLHQFYNTPTNSTNHHLQRDYTTLTRSLPLASSFYDEGVYHYLANGLQTPQNTFYLPSPTDLRELLRAHNAVQALREELQQQPQNSHGLTIAWPELQLLFTSLSPPIPESIQQLYLNVVTHSVPYPLSSSPTSPQSLFHFAFDTDAAPYCYVPKIVQGVLSPTSARPTLMEHQQLSYSRSFKRKNQIEIEAPVASDATGEAPTGAEQTEASNTTPILVAEQAVNNNSNSNAVVEVPPPNTFSQLPLGDVSFNMLWTWRHSTINHQYLHIFQKVNHFQRSGHLTRKDALSKNVMRFLKPFTVHDQRLLSKVDEVKQGQEKQEVVRFAANLEILPHSYVFPLDLKQFYAEYQSRQLNCLECGGSGRVPKIDDGNTVASNGADTNTHLSQPLTTTAMESPSSSTAIDSTTTPTPDDQPCSCQLWIIKPVNSSRGRGIFITDDVATFAQPYQDFYDGVSLQSLYGGKKPSGATRSDNNSPISSSTPQQEVNGNSTATGSTDETIANNDKVFKFAETTDFPPVVVQHYVNNPLLLHKRKFDLRIYVLVVSFEPLEAYVYNEGYARFAGSEFSADINNLHGHLTNSSLNLEVVQQEAKGNKVAQQQDGANGMGEEVLASTNPGMDATTVDPTTAVGTTIHHTTSPIEETEPQKSTFSVDFHKSHSVPHPTFSPSVLENVAGSNAPTFDNCKQLFSEWMLDMIQTFGPDGSHHHHQQQQQQQQQLSDNNTQPIHDLNQPSTEPSTEPSTQALILDPIKLLRDIDRTILNSLLVVSQRIGPQSNAFELFGYDVMIDDNYRPWLLEVNSSPSLNLNTDIDTLVKPQLLADTVSLVGLLPYDRSVLAGMLSELEEKASGQGPVRWDFKTSGSLSGGSMLLNAGKSTDDQAETPQSSNQHRSTKVDTEESNLAGAGQPGSIDAIKKHTFYEDSTTPTTGFHEDPINQLFSNLLSNFRSRFYGELPVNIGNFRRLAPNGNGSVWAEQLPFKNLLKRFSNPGLPHGMKLKNVAIASTPGGSG